LKTTVELSLYPLSDNFEECILLFISKLKENKELNVYTHSMSTFVKGDHHLILSGIASALEDVNQHTETMSLVMKLINRDLPVEKGFLSL